MMRWSVRLTAKEIAKKLGVGEKAVRQRALRQKWPYVEEPNPKGGKPIKYFLLEHLPEDIKNSIATEHNGTSQPTENKGKNKGNGTQRNINGTPHPSKSPQKTKGYKKG